MNEYAASLCSDERVMLVTSDSLGGLQGLIEDWYTETFIYKPFKFAELDGNFIHVGNHTFKWYKQRRVK